MRSADKKWAALLREIAELRGQLEKAEETLRAIRSEGVDVKEAEEALRRSTARLETLRAIDQAILAAAAPRAIAEAALRALQSLVSCWRAGLMLFNPQTHQGAVLAVVGAGEALFPPGMQLSLEEIGPDDLHAVQASRVYVVEDVLTLSAPPQTVHALQTIGLRSYARVPLRAHGALLGILNLWFDRPGAWPPESVDIVCEVADHGVSSG
jgi:GAF domain-containing protein